MFYVFLQPGAASKSPNAWEAYSSLILQTPVYMDSPDMDAFLKKLDKFDDQDSYIRRARNNPVTAVKYLVRHSS